MNDHELDLALADMGAHHARVSVPDVLRRRVSAIPTTTPQHRGFLPPLAGRIQSMFSATKFVVSGVIVALFGGFLLTGVLTQQGQESLPAVGASATGDLIVEPTTETTTEAHLTDEATTTTDLLPGVDLVTDEVEPGVFQVVSDGFRELSRSADHEDLPREGLLTGNIAAGFDGSVWWFGPDGFFRLGDQATHTWSEQDGVGISDDFHVAPDGTLWRSGGPPPVSFDGTSWAELSAKGSIYGFQDDGTVWIVKREEGEVRVGPLTGDGWEALPGSVLGVRFVVAEAAGGDVWVVVDDDLRRHDGNGWKRQPTPFDGIARADAGPDGTLWIRYRSLIGSYDPSRSSLLARFDGSDWDVFTRGLPGMGDHYMGFEGWFEVASDRSVWFNPIGAQEQTGTRCDGVANFDGESLVRFMRDTCIYAMDVAPDGSVWLQAGEGPWRGGNAGPIPPIYTYVITPEAVAATD